MHRFTDSSGAGPRREDCAKAAQCSERGGPGAVSLSCFSEVSHIHKNNSIFS